MKKDTFYFSHDYNAHDDVKILFLRQELGMEGYGIFWFLIEKLADSGGILPLNLTPVLAMQMHTSETKVLGVINQYGLFNIIENEFFSERLLEHLKIRKHLSDSGTNGADERWGIDRVANGGDISIPNGDGNAKERKGKEKKVKEIKEEYNTFKDTEDNKHNKNLESSSTPESLLENSNLFRKPNIPTFEQVYEDCIRKGGTKQMAEKFFAKHEAYGWITSNGAITNFSYLLSNYIASWKENEEKNNLKAPKSTYVVQTPREDW